MRLLSGAGEAAFLKDTPWRVDSSSLESFRSIPLLRAVWRRVPCRAVASRAQPMRTGTGDSKEGQAWIRQTGKNKQTGGAIIQQPQHFGWKSGRPTTPTRRGAGETIGRLRDIIGSMWWQESCLSSSTAVGYATTGGARVSGVHQRAPSTTLTRNTFPCFVGGGLSQRLRIRQMSTQTQKTHKNEPNRTKAGPERTKAEPTDRMSLSQVRHDTMSVQVTGCHRPLRSCKSSNTGAHGKHRCMTENLQIHTYIHTYLSSTPAASP